MRTSAGIVCCCLLLLTGFCSHSRALEEEVAASDKPGRVSSQKLDSSQRVAPGVDMIMHRQQAGDLDESGWCHAGSTEGGFSVSLPNLFNDFTITAKAEDGVEGKTFVVGTQDKRLVKFSAVAIRRLDGKFKSDPVDGVVAHFEKQGGLKEKRRVSLGKMKGVELRVASGSSLAVIRLYKGPATLYELIVEAPSSIRAGEIAGDVKKFMDSFTVSDKAQR